MSAHTPGPWVVDGSRVRGSGGRDWVCETSPGGRFSKSVREENDADARLIAAAPDLLAACETAERLLLDGVGREKVRAAIAKARGK